jgi:periplasmic copper chaperone A
MYLQKMRFIIKVFQHYFSISNLLKAAGKASVVLFFGLSFALNAMEHSHNHHAKNKDNTASTPNAVKALVLVDGFVRAVPPGQSTTAIFLTLRNEAKVKVDIVGIDSSIGHHAMLHKTIISDDMAKMVHLDSVSIAPNSTLKLAPGGMHIMIMGVSQSLQIDQKITVTLNFSDQTQQTFEVPVALK